MVDSKKSSS